jgi:hypothetical protein
MSPGFVMSMEPFTVIPVDGGEREITIGSGALFRTRNRYNEFLGSLLYIANTTGPDISLAVSVLLDTGVLLPQLIGTRDLG